MQLEVWGDPIGHSKSPSLHAAAYRVLGLDWTYSRRQVSAAQFAGEFATLDESFRGLSLTMPLKEQAFAVAVWRDQRAELTGSVNTLVLGPQGPHGYNTDIGGFLGALRENGVESVDDARIIGAGATASSALIALAEAGARTVQIVARTPQKAATLIAMAQSLGIEANAVSFDDVALFDSVDATIATLPGGTTIDPDVAIALAKRGGVLLDAVYSPWPTQLGSAFIDAKKFAASGQLMLLHQAILQVRLFVLNDVNSPLESEDVILAAMRGALMGD